MEVRTSGVDVSIGKNYRFNVRAERYLIYSNMRRKVIFCRIVANVQEIGVEKHH